MNKNLEYYMGLPYVIEVVPIPESEGGGFQASLPEVGRLAVLGDGETFEEAISNLVANKRERFAEYLEKGVSIPEPTAEDAFSGKFILRIPSRLHMLLNERAKRKKLSLNQYIRQLLEEHNASTEILAEIKSLRNEVKALNRTIREEIAQLVHRVSSLEESYSPLSMQPGNVGVYTVLLEGAHTQVGRWTQSQWGAVINSNLPSSDTEGFVSCSVLKAIKRR